jgi:dihydrofolate reductase
MGRKTFESIGHPLPKRTNIVISSSPIARTERDVHFVQSKESALYLADYYSILSGSSDVFVIGGGMIYEAFQRQFNKVYLTEVHAKGLRGDAHFKYRFGSDRWRLIEKHDFEASDVDDYPFSIKVYVRKRKKDRSRVLSEFLTPSEHLHGWERRELENIDPNAVVKSVARL